MVSSEFYNDSKYNISFVIDRPIKDVRVTSFGMINEIGHSFSNAMSDIDGKVGK